MSISKCHEIWNFGQFLFNTNTPLTANPFQGITQMNDLFTVQKCAGKLWILTVMRMPVVRNHSYKANILPWHQHPPDGIGPPAGQCALHTTKIIQEQPEELKKLKCSQTELHEKSVTNYRALYFSHSCCCNVVVIPCNNTFSTPHWNYFPLKILLQ